MAAKEISVKKYVVRLSPDEREQLEARDFADGAANRGRKAGRQFDTD